MEVWKMYECNKKMNVKKILIVIGTRPEAIKMIPVVFELKKRVCFTVKICVTGQHKEMLFQVLDLFGIIPDYNLGVMKNGQKLTDIMGKIQKGISEILDLEKPHLTLVHGDTITAMAVSVTCFLKHFQIGHVEAGLRTYNIQEPFPEEYDRRVISLGAKYHFAPTQSAKNNLVSEKICGSIYVTGNTAIDMFQYTVKKEYKSVYLNEFKDKKLILVTIHRRENWDVPMRNIFKAIRHIADEYERDVGILYPVHLNPQIRKEADNIFSDADNVKLIAPMKVIDFHNIMARAYLIVTDSGGIQEEAPYFGKPVLVARNVTERPEGIQAGTLKLIGTKESDVYNGIKELLENRNIYTKMSRAVNPYGDGTASIKIADILEESLI